MTLVVSNNEKNESPVVSRHYLPADGDTAYCIFRASGGWHPSLGELKARWREYGTACSITALDRDGEVETEAQKLLGTCIRESIREPLEVPFRIRKLAHAVQMVTIR